MYLEWTDIAISHRAFYGELMLTLKRKEKNLGNKRDASIASLNLQPTRVKREMTELDLTNQQRPLKFGELVDLTGEDISTPDLESH